VPESDPDAEVASPTCSFFVLTPYPHFNTLAGVSDDDVELLAIAKEFDGQRAVRGVTLSVRRGEFFSLLGPSGCGKTTVLRLIAGFDAPSAGRIRLGGADVTELRPHRRDVNLVFQSYALFPHLDVFENVAFGLRMAKARDVEPRVRDALATVRLPGYERRTPATLSGGEQQRVALARAIVTRPRVLLLDEPLSALDRKLRRAMQEELKRIQREVGLTFLYVTHDQEEALSMSDRIAVMNEGRIEQVGAPADVYEHPSTRFVAEFLGSANFFEGVVENGTLLTEDGLELAAPPGAGRGPATLLVRADKIIVGNGGALDAVVEEVLYQGERSSLVLRAGQRRLVATTTDGLRIGDRTVVSWRPEDARLLSR
jgi:spermidine/putrescine transport system ATP-binding protein